jgi:integrase
MSSSVRKCQNDEMARIAGPMAVTPRRALRRLFKRAKIKKPDDMPKRCHPHMFRDTFAVSSSTGLSHRS